MPLYDVICTNCNFSQTDFEKSIHVDLETVKCPSCKKRKLLQDYSKPKPMILRDNTPKTVGQVAERNAKIMGKELHQLEGEKILGEKGMKKKKAETPWWRPEGSKPLDVTKIKDTAKYIRTGEKD